MFLTDYLSDLTKTIDKYSKTDLILSSEMMTDFRTEKIGLIKGPTLWTENCEWIF